jgi:hypothetical protein
MPTKRSTLIALRHTKRAVPHRDPIKIGAAIISPAEFDLIAACVRRHGMSCGQAARLFNRSASVIGRVLKITNGKTQEAEMPTLPARNETAELRAGPADQAAG